MNRHNQLCEWRYNAEYDTWETYCNSTYQFEQYGPNFYGFDYCPFCGGDQKEGEPIEQPEDDGDAAFDAMRDDQLTEAV